MTPQTIGACKIAADLTRVASVIIANKTERYPWWEEFIVLAPEIVMGGKVGWSKGRMSMV